MGIGCLQAHSMCCMAHCCHQIALRILLVYSGGLPQQKDWDMSTSARTHDPMLPRNTTPTSPSKGEKKRREQRIANMAYQPQISARRRSANYDPQRAHSPNGSRSQPADVSGQDRDKERQRAAELEGVRGVH